MSGLVVNSRQTEVYNPRVFHQASVFAQIAIAAIVDGLVSLPLERNA